MHFYYTIVISIFARIWSVICGLYELKLCVNLESEYFNQSFKIVTLSYSQYSKNVSADYCIGLDINIS